MHNRTDTPAVTYAASAGTVTDPAENPLADFTRTISNEADDTSPTIISFTTTSSNPTRVSTITYDVVFSEPVTFDSVSGISVTGTSGAAANTPTGSGASHTFTVTRGTTDGTVIVSLSEGAARDDAGNDSEASDEITITIDTERPVPTISANATGLTNSAAIQYTVDFGEDVDEFVASDIGVSARGISLAVPSIVEVSAGVYDFTISHGINEGIVTAQVIPSIATDLAGNSNIASSLHEITIDRIAPIVDSASTLNANTIVLEISEDVTGGDAADFTLSGVATNPAVSSIDVAGSTITLSLNGAIAEGDSPAVYEASAGSIEDLATNPLAAFTDHTVDNEIDTTRPTITIFETTLPEHTNSTSITFTVRFSESVTGFDDASDVTITGTSGGTVNAPTGTGAEYTFTVNRGATDGTITVLIPEDAARDDAGNPNTASGSVTRTIDTIPPTVTISADAQSPTNLGTIQYEASFDETITGVSFDDIVLEGSSETTVIFGGSGVTYTYGVSHDITEGELTASVRAGAATDLAGNTNAASVPLVLTVDRVPPEVDSASVLDARTVRLVMSEGIVDSESVSFNFRVSGIATDPDPLSATFGDNTIDLAFEIDIEDDDVLVLSYTRTTGSINDTATNILADFSGFTVTNELDTTPPTPTVSNGDISLTNQSPLPFTVRFDESVTGLAEDEITVNGPARVVPGSLVTDDNVDYTFDVERVDSDGEITVFIAHGAAVDGDQNLSTTSNVVVFTFDITPPTVTGDSIPDSNTIVLEISEDVTGGNEADFTISGVNSNPGITSIVVSGTTITLNLNNAIIDTDTPAVTYAASAGTVTDLAENPLAGFTRTISNEADDTSPTIISFTTTSSNPTRVSTITYDVVFSEPVTFDSVSGISVTGTSGAAANTPTGSGASHTFTVTRGTTDGTVIVSLSEGAARDDAGNDSEASDEITITIDTERPVPTISANATGLTNSAAIQYTVDFGEDVDEFVASDIGVSARGISLAVPSIVEVSAGVYDFTISHGINEGNVTAQVLPFIATDAAGNSNIASSLHEITIDRIAPEVDSASVLDARTVRLVMSEPISETGDLSFDFTVFGISSGGQVESVEVSGSMIDITVNRNMVETDSLTVTYAAQFGSINDMATNPLADFANQIVTNNIDNTPPTIISFETTSSDFTNSQTVTYTVEFSESVTGFDISGISVTGTSGATATIPEGDGASYTFDVNRGDTDGTVTASILAGAARDDAGNDSEASDSVTVTIDTIPPEVDTALVLDATTVRLVMSESVSETGDSSFDFTVFGISSGAQVESVEVSGSMIDITVNRNIVETDSLTVTYATQFGSINDTATNPLADFEGEPVTNDIDNTAPVPTVSNGNIDLTNRETIPFTVRFDEPVTGFNATGIKVSEFAGIQEHTFVPANATVYNFNIQADDDGEVTVSILAGAARDGQGNPSVASNTVRFTIDTTPPTVTGGSVPGSNIIALEMSEPVFDRSATAADFAISGVSSGPSVVSIAVSGSTITLNLNNAVTDGDSPTVSYAASSGAIEDLATNRLADFEDEPVTNDIDTTAPVPTVSNGNIDLTNREIIPFTVRFDEPVTGFNATGIKVSGSAGIQEHTFVPANATVYNFNIQAAEDGEVTVSVAAGVARDDDDNLNMASNSITVTIDTQRPVPTISANATGLTNSAAIQYTVDFGETVTGFVASDISVFAGSARMDVSGLEGDDDTYAFTITHGINAGDVTALVLEGAARDAAGNTNAASVPLVLTVDRVLDSASVLDARTVRLVMSEGIVDSESVPFNFRVSGIATDPDPLSATFGDNTIDLAFEIDIEDDDVLVLSYARSTGSINDTATNILADFSGFTVTNELDTTPPTPTVSNGDISLTNQLSLPFTVRFDESVTGLAEDEITVNGPARVVPSSLVTDDNVDYTFDVERVDSDGEITVFIAHGAAIDEDQNLSTTSNVVVFTIDTTVPVVIGDSIPNSNTIVLETSEPVTGGVASEFIISGITPALTVDTIEVSGNTITLNLSDSIPDGGSLTVTYAASAGTVTDLAENSLAGFTRTIFNEADDTPPTIISFTTTSNAFTFAPIITYNVQFSESVTFDDTDGISVTGTSGGTANIPTGSGTEYAFTVIRGATDGPVIVSLSEGAAHDDANNPSEASNSITVTVDTQRPVPTISANATGLTNSAAIQYTVDFGEDVDEFVASDIGVSARGISLAVPSIVEVSAGVYDFTISHGINEGNVTAQVLPFIATDAAGNSNIESSLHEITIDRIAPIVDSASTLNANTIVLEISEDVTGGDAADFTLSGVATNPAVSSIDVAGSTITLSLDGAIAEGDSPAVTYEASAGSIEDLAENPLADFANESVTNNLDTTRPTVTTFTTTSSNPTNSQTITYNVQFSESVTGFSAAGIDVTGTSGGTANEPTGAGRDYEFTVTRGISDGTVTVTIMEGAARDADDNLSFASSPVEITVDATPPTVTGAEVLNPNIIRLDLSEPISDNNAVASDFAIAGAASNPAVSSIAVSGSSIELSLTPSLTDADNPTVSYTRTTGGIEDPATNRLADFAGFTVTNDIDTTDPVPTLSTEIDSPTNLAVIPYMVEFTEAVSGFDGNGIDASIDGASLTASEPVTDDDTTYTFTVTHNVNEGELQVSIRAGAATDMDSNTSTASNTISHTIDRIAPTVTGASVSDTDTIILDISELLSESESVGVTSDFTISGVATNPSVASIVITGSTITLDLNSLITDADNPVISYTGTAGSIEDLAENPLAAFTDRTVENEIDTTGPVPTLTITSDPGATHTNGPEVSYRVEFDMDVDGFDMDDIEVSGSADGGNPEVTTFVTVSGSIYTFDVERDSSDGNVMVFIPADRATDRSGNQNVASDRLEIIFDTISPTLTLASAESGDTRLRTIPFNVTFSERVDDFDINDIIIEGSATANTPTTSDDIFYEFDLVATSDGPVTVSIRENAARDMADNGNAESETIALTVDTERPTVEITSLTVDDLPTNLESISYTVAFNEQVNDFVAGDISASIDGSPLTASSPVPGADNTYTFDVTHGTNEGELVVSIPENVTTDNAGNNNTASNELVHTVDRIAPTVVSASVSDTDTIILGISESVSGGIAFDFAISGVNSGPEVDSIAVSGSTITLNLDDSITDADLPLLSYTGTTGSIEDPATNPLANFANQAVMNNLDTTRPTVTSFTTTSSNPTNSQTITYAVQFSESVTGFSAAGIDVTGTSGGTANEPTGAGRDYEFTVTRGISDGTVTVTIMEGAARDADDNLSFASSPVEITVDATPPTVTGAEVLNPNIIRLDLSEPISDNNAVASDFAIAGAASNPAVSSIAVSGSSIELSLTPSLTDADNPTVSYTRTTGGIEDPATNRLADFAGFTVTNDIDTTDPVPTLSTEIDSPTNLAVIPYMVEFTEAVSGFDGNGIDASIDGASLTASEPVTDDDTTYTFTVTHNVNEGELQVSIRAGAATDMDSNTSTASNTISHTIDRIAPTVTGASVSDTDTIILDISELLSESESVGVTSDFTISGVATNPSVASIVITGSTITLDLNSLITDADNPVISYTGTAGSIEDLAENPLAAFTDRTVENEIDTTGPVPTLTITSDPGATHTNGPEVSYRVEFDMDVDGFDMDDIEVSGSADGGNPEVTTFVTVSGSIYTFDVERDSSDGNVMVFIPADRATDRSGNQNVASDRLEIIFDTISPTLTLASAESGDTRLRTIPFNVTFSERVDDFDINDIIIEGSATANTPTTSDDIFYEFDLVATSDGPVTVSIRENAARDMADNGNAESETIALTVDTERPTVEITSLTVDDLPTNLESISYTVAFNEQVNDFVAGDISASIDGSPLTASSPVPGADNTYTFDVTHGTNEGELVVSIPENVTTDNAGNNNTASNELVHTVDRIAPTVVSASVSDTDTIILGISESVSGGIAFDFAISGVNSGPEVDSIAVSGSTITLNLDDSITDADLPLLSYTGTTGSIEDPATNPLANFANQAVMNNLDTTRPTVTSFTTTSSNPTNSQTITYAVQFSEPVTRFNSTGISVTGTSGGTAAEPTGTGRDYEFVVTRGVSDGTVTVTILEGAARDVDNNLSFASSPVEITVDATPPTVTGATVSDTDTIILEISEPVSGGAASDFTISGVNSDPVVNSIDVTGSTVTLNLDDSITDADNPAVSYTGTVDIEDAAENPLADFANESVTNNLDTTRPTVTSFTTTSSNPTNSQTITYAVQFSEPVTRFNSTGISVTGTSGGTAAEPTGGGINYEFVVTRGASDGTVTVTILEGAARDVDDNLSFASSLVEIVIDATPPTVTGAEVVNPNIIRLDLSEPVSDINAVASDFAISSAASNPAVSSIAVSGSSIELSLSQPLTDADNPTVAYTRTAGGIEDPATNRLADFVNQMVTNDIDTTEPVGLITMLSTTDTFPTNNRTVQFRVNFTETVTFDVDRISVGGVTLNTTDPEFTIMLGSLSSTNVNTSMGPGRDFNFTLMYDGTDGTVPVYIPANSVMTEGEIGNMESNMIDAVFDFTDPEVTGVRMMDHTTIRLSMSESVNNITSVRSEDFKVTNMTDDGVEPAYATSITAFGNQSVILHFDQSILEYHTPEVRYNKTKGAIEDVATNTLKNFTRALSTSSDDRTGDPGWRTKPTFGSSHITGDPIVSCGYSIDGRCTDVLDYHVNYTRQTIQTNSTHDFALKTYAQRGVKQFELAFSVPDIGAPINSAEAVITIDLVRNYTEPSTHSIDKISYTNKNNVIGQNATFAVSQVKCLPSDPELDCIRLDIMGVLFREEMYHVPFAIHATDYKLRGTINYLNEGILVQGETLNELPVVTRSTKSASQSEPLVIQLTRTDKLADIWTDQFGDTWTKNEWDTWRYVDRPTPSMVSSCRDIENRLCDAFAEKLDWHTTNMERIRDALYGKIYTEPAFDDLKETIIVFDTDGASTEP